MKKFLSSIVLFITLTTVYLLSTVFLSPYDVNKPVYAAACVFAPTTINTGEKLGVILNGFTPGIHTVKIAGRVFGNVVVLGGIPDTGGGVDIPLSTIAPQDYDVVVETGFGLGSDVTCTGILHVDPSVPPPPPSGSKSCGLNGATVFQGGIIGINHNGFNAGESIRIFGPVMQKEIGFTTDSSLSPVLVQDVNIPVDAPVSTDHFIVIVASTVMYTCTGGPLNIVPGTGDTGGKFAIVVNIDGCTALGCQATAPVSGTFSSSSEYHYSFPAGKFAANTIFDVYICTPDCGTGKYVLGWEPKNCKSAPDGSLDVNWQLNTCGIRFAADPTPFTVPTAFPPGARFSTFGQLASDIVLILTSIAGSLGFIMIVIAGVKFVTSSGDQKKLESARNTLTYAIIGLAVSTFVFIMIRILQFVLKAKVI